MFVNQEIVKIPLGENTSLEFYFLSADEFYFLIAAELGIY